LTLKEVRKGLYERIDTPKRVPLTGKFIKAVRSSTGSDVVTEIVRIASLPSGNEITDSQPKTQSD
jgi:hypothetical protein